MNKSLSLLTVLLIVSTSLAWSANIKPKPVAVKYAVSMQAVGTFDEQAPSAKISMAASPDETEPASFSVYSAKAISDATVKLSGDLVSGKNKLSAGQVALFEVGGTPEERLSVTGKFQLAAAEAKRFWITVDVPKGTRAGTYRGAVALASGGKTICELPISLEVRGMRLLKSSKQYGLMLPNTTVDDTYKQTLAQVVKLGFGLVSTAVPPETLAESLMAIKAAGVSTFVVPYTFHGLTPDSVEQVRDRAKAAGVNRLVVCVANDPKTPEDVQAATAMVESVHAAGLKTFAVLSDPSACDQLNNSLDTVDLHASLPYPQALISGQKRTAMKNEWLFWDPTENPKENRLNAGLVLWKSWLEGIFIPVTAAPEGSISLMGTIRAEALRAGIDDTRYLTSVMAPLREVKDALKVGGTKNAVAAKQTADDTEAYIKAVMSKPLKDMKNQECQDVRAKLAKYTVKLQSLLK